MKTMVAGIGNVFMTDDGFGSEVIAQLRATPTPPDVRVEDYGIRGMHLALDLLDGYDMLILVDTLAGTEAPGTVRVVEPDPSATGDGVAGGHDMSAEATLRLFASLGGTIGRVLLVGCQPASLDPGMGLSPEVRAAVAPAVRAIGSLLEGT